VFRIAAADALESRFGSWPSFHDAEVVGVRLDSGQRSDGCARLELDVHVLEQEGTGPDGQPKLVDHSLVTLEFAGIENLELGGFGPQNVLFDLVLRDTGPDAPSAATLQVELPSSNGLGGSFCCSEATVLAVELYEPGPHSVYSS
jgi:hypothetical protein